MTEPNPWDWEIESRIVIEDAQDAYEKTYGGILDEITETAALTAVRLTATAYRTVLERAPGIADIHGLLESHYGPRNLGWLVETVERSQWTDAGARRTAKEIARWHKHEWRENEDTTRFPGTLHWNVRDDVRRLLKHLADSLGEGAEAPLAQLPRGSPERRAAAERLGIREPHEEKAVAEREFGAAFAEALEKRAASDAEGAETCRMIAWAARQALKKGH